MKNLETILEWLSGKKSVIAGLITTTSAYWVTIGYVQMDTALYINAMTLIIFGSASYATGKIVYKK